jgi:hypothetical protein
LTDSAASSAVRRLSVEEVAPRRRTEPIPIPETLSSTSSQPSTLEVVVAAFTGLGYAVSARALLLLALIFVFTLAVMAMLIQTLMSLYVLVAGGVLTVIPAAILEIRRRSP